MLDRCYSVAHADIVFENFDGDLVVLDLRSGRYFGFNPIGAATWSTLMAGVMARQLVAVGLDESSLLAFLKVLLDKGIAIPSEGDGGPVPESYQQLLRSHGGEAPSIEAFDDLADLMLADPIHDVDAEMGWPHRPTDK